MRRCSLRLRHGAYLFVLFSLMVSALAFPAPEARPALETTPPEGVGLSRAKLDAIEETINQAIAEGKLPGAVVLIGRNGKIAFKKAYGRRALRPRPAAMTTDT